MSSPIVIKVENLSKQYRIGSVGTKSLGDDIKRFTSKILGKEDPFLKVGEVNDRTNKGNSDYVWALRDINFDVKQGEVLGIIGKNGAGKSTLLKILSKVTRPTTGEYKVKGRIASLLEVGTGFHPDLTGRENVFLNGAILGMTKQEIKSKFDEIVDFSGVERYIDTPVKRYSSGMYVRLAFAVAAHLEPEILIIDEVLAVGDVEFQRKCLGKMKDVSLGGRTILFVSHNTAVIQSLCTRAILLDKGKVVSNGDTSMVLENYFMEDSKDVESKSQHIVSPNWPRPWGQKSAAFQTIELINAEKKRTEELLFTEPFTLKITFENSETLTDVKFQVRTAKMDGMQITRSDSHIDTTTLYTFAPGKHTVEVEMKPNLMPGQYCFYIYLCSYDSSVFYDAISNFYPFKVLNKTANNQFELSVKVNTLIHLPCDWKTLN